MSLPKIPKPSVFFCLAALSFAALLLPQHVIELLSAYSSDFTSHSCPRFLLGLVRLITYQFMHGGMDHFKYNFLFAIAPCLYLEKRLGKKAFLAFYLIAGIVSAAVFLIAMHFSPVGHFFASIGLPMALLGASGSIYGCMTLAALVWGCSSIYNAMISGLFFGLFVWEQVQLAISSLTLPAPVAYWGHVGGVIAALCVFPIILIYDYKRRTKSTQL